MCVLVDHPEDRQDGVVETTHKLLFQQFNFLQALNFLLDNLEDGVLHIVTKLSLLESILKEALGCLEVFRIGVGARA